MVRARKGKGKENDLVILFEKKNKNERIKIAKGF